MNTSPLNHYLIHDNGTRPFCVEQHKDIINIFTNGDGHEKRDLIFKTPYIKLWVGKDRCLDGEHIRCDGNSLLIQLTENDFIFVGQEIQKFKLRDYDKPVFYISDISTIDIPYPYLIGEKYVYLMLTGVVIKRDVFDDVVFSDIYKEYFWPTNNNEINQLYRKYVEPKSFSAYFSEHPEETPISIMEKLLNELQSMDEKTQLQMKKFLFNTYELPMETIIHRRK